MHGGTIPVRTHLRGPRTSLCLLDDPVTFAINEDHAPKILGPVSMSLFFLMRQFVSVGLAKTGRSAKRAKTKSRTLCVDRWRARWSVLSARGSSLHREGGNPSPSLRLTR